MDRNYIIKITRITPAASLSARRAWIEISSAVVIELLILLSLSARRAWIEIAQGWRVSGRTLVALRKESVDRNAC